MLRLTTDEHKTSRGLSATAELLVRYCGPVERYICDGYVVSPSYRRTSSPSSHISKEVRISDSVAAISSSPDAPRGNIETQHSNADA